MICYIVEFGFNINVFSCINKRQIFQTGKAGPMSCRCICSWKIKKKHQPTLICISQSRLSISFLESEHLWEAENYQQCQPIPSPPKSKVRKNKHLFKIKKKRIAIQKALFDSGKHLRSVLIRRQRQWVFMIEKENTSLEGRHWWI